MIRVNSMKHITIEQSISFTFETRDFSHIVTYHNSKEHIYKREKFSDFASACKRFEELEIEAKAYENRLTA